MSFTLTIRSPAVKNTNDAYWWYEEKKIGLGEEFLEEISLAYQRISAHPILLVHF
jgi:hypothetical protein